MIIGAAIGMSRPHDRDRIAARSRPESVPGARGFVGKPGAFRMRRDRILLKHRFLQDPFPKGHSS
jgi:hypothetical protein